jgi:hypothetical protein
MEKQIFQGVDTLVIRVTNILLAKSWYTEKLGLSLAYEDDDMRLVILNGWGETSVTLWQSESQLIENKNCGYYVTFKSDNSTETRDELIRRGVKVGELLSDDTYASFIFEDLEGKTFEVRQTYSKRAAQKEKLCFAKAC